QPEAALAVIEAEAREAGVAPLVMGTGFDAYGQHGRMVYQDEKGLLDLPLPALAGPHQIENAGLAIATLRHAGLGADEATIARGLKQAQWPARLTRLAGVLSDYL